MLAFVAEAIMLALPVPFVSLLRAGGEVARRLIS
jgi:hypothetical protein